MKIESQWAAVAGAKVHYLSAGPIGGHLVVLLHGAAFRPRPGGRLARSTPWLRPVTARLAVDMPGFGQSPPSPGPSPTWLVDLFDQLQIGRAVLLAASMSGAVGTADGHRASRADCRLCGGCPRADQAPPRPLGGHHGPGTGYMGRERHHDSAGRRRLLVRIVPNGSLVVIPNGSHAPYMSDPARFHEVLLEFLAGLSWPEHPARSRLRRAKGGTSLSVAKGVVSPAATPFVPQGVPPENGPSYFDAAPYHCHSCSSQADSGNSMTRLSPCSCIARNRASQPCRGRRVEQMTSRSVSMAISTSSCKPSRFEPDSRDPHPAGVADANETCLYHLTKAHIVPPRLNTGARLAAPSRRVSGRSTKHLGRCRRRLASQ